MMQEAIDLNGKRFEPYISAEGIAAQIKALSVRLNVDYSDKKPVFVAVLKGSFLFFADLLRQFGGDCETEFVKLSSYDGTQSSGSIKDSFGIPENLHNRNVIIVEDIVETGLTLQFLSQKIAEQRPASLQICSLLYKPKAQKAALIDIRYVGFEIENDFVVGYGLDYQGFGRNLPAIYKAI
jgi:hypoxanthine phosphoribosyltransferase